MADTSKALKVSLIVPVWNRADQTVRCLEGVRTHLSNKIDELVVVDNGSTDQTANVLERFEERSSVPLRTVRHNQNIGFGPGCNSGVDISQGAIIILLNNDVRILGDFITPIVQVLTEHPESLVGPQLVDFDSGWNSFGNKIVPYVGGWLLGMWFLIWNELKGFDPQFVPCDFEDMDLSCRAVQKGIQLRQLTLPVQHVGGTTARQLERRWEITEMNRQRFATKHGLEISK